MTSSIYFVLDSSFSPQNLQEHCSNGQALLSAVLTSRERVIPWGIPQIEDRALDTAQREWAAYQSRLKETQGQLHSMLTRLRQMGHKFLSLAQWLEEMERVANIRSNRRSDATTKQIQLKKLQVRKRPDCCSPYKIQALDISCNCQHCKAQKGTTYCLIRRIYFWGPGCRDFRKLLPPARKLFSDTHPSIFFC